MDIRAIARGAERGEPLKVAFFPGCLVDMLYPEVGLAAVRVLERLDCEIILPDKQVCCGQMFYNSGYGPAGSRIIRNTIDAYTEYETIVSLSGSCAYALKGEARKFLMDDEEYLAKLDRLKPRMFEFTEFIVDKLGVTDVGAYFPHTVTYHKSCHLPRLLGIERQPLALLNAVEGLEYVPMRAADRCCGFGGTFSVKEPEISEAMVTEKVQTALDTGAEYLVGADQPCLMNIGGRLDRLREEGAVHSDMQVVHIAQILDSRKGA